LWSKIYSWIFHASSVWIPTFCWRRGLWWINADSTWYREDAVRNTLTLAYFSLLQLGQWRILLRNKQGGHGRCLNTTAYYRGSICKTQWTHIWYFRHHTRWKNCRGISIALVRNTENLLILVCLLKSYLCTTWVFMKYEKNYVFCRRLCVRLYGFRNKASCKIFIECCL